MKNKNNYNTRVTQISLNKKITDKSTISPKFKTISPFFAKKLQKCQKYWLNWIYLCKLKIFKITTKLNTFMKMFNKIIPNYGYSEIKAGIGCDKDLIIKAGRTGTGINDKIYIGNAIIDACNFASEGNRNGIEPIVMSKVLILN